MGWKWGTKSKWYNGHKRREGRTDLNYDRHGNTRTNNWATTWTTSSIRWAKRSTNRQQRVANRLCISFELAMHAEHDWDDEDYLSIDELYLNWLHEYDDYDPWQDLYYDSYWQDLY